MPLGERLRYDGMRHLKYEEGRTLEIPPNSIGGKSEKGPRLRPLLHLSPLPLCLLSGRISLDSSSASAYFGR
jgi:hypothetical protein